MDRSSDSAGVIVFPPLLFVGTLGLGLALHWLEPVHLLPSLVARLLGFTILILSWLLVQAAEKAMSRAGTFRVTRNPMYLASIGVPGRDPTAQRAVAAGPAPDHGCSRPRCFD